MQAQAEALPTLFTPSLETTSSSVRNADRELQRRVRNYLQNRRLPQAQLRIDAENGVVTLRGTHRSFYHKQLCISCCQRVAGVVQLVDATKVDSPR